MVSVKVVGSYLRGQPDIEVWQEAVTILESAGGFDGELNLFKKLILSCTGLDQCTLDMFLEVACVRLGCEEELAKRSWLRSNSFFVAWHLGAYMLHEHKP